MKKKLVLVAALIISTLNQLQAQDSYTTTLKKYFEVSGSMEAFKSAITGMISQFKTMNSSIPEEFWKEMESEMMKTSADDLVVQMTPVYKKHLTEAELNDIIKFYATPSGKKLASKTTVIMQESMEVGQQWGQSIGGKVMQKMKEKGY